MYIIGFEFKVRLTMINTSTSVVIASTKFKVNRAKPAIEQIVLVLLRDSISTSEEPNYW